MEQVVESLRSADPELREVDIEQIVVRVERFRPLGELAALAESIREIGLTNPIKVNADLVLLNGRHRLEACRSLGWKTIRAFVYDADLLRQELIGIDDDLCRKELTPLERGERMARKKEIYETLYPEARSINVRGGPGRGNAKTTATVAAVSFVADTAQKTGLKERTIREEIQIAKNIVPEVRDRIRGTSTASMKRPCRPPHRRRWPASASCPEDALWGCLPGRVRGDSWRHAGRSCGLVPGAQHDPPPASDRRLPRRHHSTGS